ncbi:response regulator [Novilysobacter selenitireducens]|uniref:Response regulator transcription factor n=1 Tax=Novilysobacter selenitireducens TaxID=2872639 RepID=A0ABS7T5J0_9GAMM|nr:response regulator transcription factor [Lysobacter selenitireducens]MBZ4039123.1 response regulator transcription factor [Lysobacter selenitireducens]
MAQAAFAESALRARILIADDHVLVAQGLERLLLDCFELSGVVANGQDLVEWVRGECPDVVIADVGMPRLNGIQAMAQLRADGILVPFIFLTMHAEPCLAAEALRAGAAGYVLKSAAGEELISAVRTVLEGGRYVTPSLGAHLASGASKPPVVLTDKQLQVLGLVATGMRSKQVAHQLGISIRTVESHKYAIMQALDVHSTVELVRKAEQAGLVAGASPRP